MILFLVFVVFAVLCIFGLVSAWVLNSEDQPKFAMFLLVIGVLSGLICVLYIVGVGLLIFNT